MGEIRSGRHETRNLYLCCLLSLAAILTPAFSVQGGSEVADVPGAPLRPRSCRGRLCAIILFDSVNLLDVYGAPDATEEAIVTDLHTENDRGITKYYVELETTGVDGNFEISEAYYKTLTAGGTVTVDRYNGLVGIPFVIAREDG